ncbi:MAG TPA: hypothetical protein ENF22_06535 [Chloroflexi bacterium]|nr:hypothetical protein [Chloroflexota bacterium]
MKSRIKWLMVALSHKITMQIGARYGPGFPMHFVCGYPRSGTTWFSELLADYLNLPRPRHYILPLGFSCVVHTHVPSSHRLSDCFYVLRDGRDCLVSAYFKLIKNMEDDKDYVYGDVYAELFGGNYDDPGKNIELYVDYIFTHRKHHWGRHVKGWLDKKRQHPETIVIARYEELVRETREAFIQVLLEKYGSVKEEFVNSAVERQQFERQIKRSEDQHRTFLRKGKTGDWRNWFTPESARIFDKYAGDVLIEAGYEQDHSWIDLENNDHRD